MLVQLLVCVKYLKFWEVYHLSQFCLFKFKC